MDLMGSHLEAAFERLYRWVQASVKEELDLGGPGVDFISAALVALRQRPVLFRYCVEEMGKSRRAHILGTFLCALTQGGPNGVPRPIELSAHDPLRYVGDMASWLHQSMASEADLLRHILGDAANDAVNGGGDDDDSDDRPKNGEHNVDSAAATSGNEAVPMAEEPTEKEICEDEKRAFELWLRQLRDSSEVGLPVGAGGGLVFLTPESDEGKR